MCDDLINCATLACPAANLVSCYSNHANDVDLL